LVAGKATARHLPLSHPVTVAPLQHSNGRLYFVGNETGVVRRDPTADRYGAVPSMSAPAPGISPLRWVRALRARWALQG
jgi:hypothetical protein